MLPTNVWSIPIPTRRNAVLRAVKRCIAKLCIPMSEEWSEWLSVIFMMDNVLYHSQHIAAPFGAVSAVHTWDRLANALTFVVRVMLKAPVARWVDDFNSAHRVGHKWPPLKCLDVLCNLLSVHLYPGKSEDDVTSMMTLGTQVIIENEDGAVSTQLDKEKAIKYDKAAM